VNGKKRAEVRVPSDADDKAIEAVVLASPAVQKHLEGKPVKKILVFKARRLVNVVV
jgi:leucyl-tRNA synthetase